MTELADKYNLIVQSLKGQLPSLPLVIDELMTIISDPDVALYAVRDIIKVDQSIYTNVLKIANTVEYRGGTEERIYNIDDAMQKIGLEKVKRIALNTSVLSLFKNKKILCDFRPELLWVHSVGVAVVSSKLSEFLNFPMNEHAYTCGLIHDIGKLAKLKYDPKCLIEEINMAKKSNTDLYTIEVLENRINHNRLGSMIVNSWGISSFVELTTKWHHEEDRGKRTDVDDPEVHKLIDIVFLSNLIVNNLEFGNSGHNLKKDQSRKILKRLRMSQTDRDEFLEFITPVLEREKDELALFYKE